MQELKCQAKKWGGVDLGDLQQQQQEVTCARGAGGGGALLKGLITLCWGTVPKAAARRAVSLLSPEASGLRPPSLPLCQDLQRLCTHTRDFHTRKQALNLEATSPRHRPTVTAQLVLHSDVAASDSRILGDNLKVIGILNTTQRVCSCACACAREHVMGAAVSQAPDSPHITGAGETSHTREMENCPTQESAITPQHKQNKAKFLAFKATCSLKEHQSCIFPNSPSLLTLPRMALCLEGGMFSCLIQNNNLGNLLTPVPVILYNNPCYYLLTRTTMQS